jgi:hypothetical protein
MELKKQIDKIDQRLDELNRRVRKLEQKVFPLEIIKPRNECVYCKHPIAPGISLCGKCKAILGEND